MKKYDVALLASVEPGFPKLHHFQFLDWNYMAIMQNCFSVALVIYCGFFYWQRIFLQIKTDMRFRE